MPNLPDYLSKINLKSNLFKNVHGLLLSLLTSAVLVTFSAHAQTSGTDSDGDGLQDSYEIKIGSESYLSDTDGDDIKDAIEVGDNKDKPKDTDNDGVIDVLDYDDDNDGLPTYLESKKDSDKDGKLDYLDADSDNDGVADGEEAGVLNQDKNLDGIDDAFDMKRDGAVDNNGDGIDDNVKLPDHNNDGKPDYLDPEYQNQKKILVKKKINKTKLVAKKVPVNKASVIEKTVNKPVKAKKVVAVKDNPKDSKSKAANMVINRHTDSDNDGLSNALEKILGTNHLSRDSDNDKVSDAIEIGLDVNSPQDSDRDGIIDALDEDDDNDGVLTKFEDLNKDSTAINDDTDADGVPNYLDANDDGDSLLTKVEGFVLDSDGDGILDYLDKNDGTKNQSNSSNTSKVTNNDNESTEPEIVVLFDGDAAALVEEDDALEDISDNSVQNDILNSLDGMLQNDSLEKSSKEIISNASKETSGKIQTSKSSNQSNGNHWNLF